MFNPFARTTEMNVCTIHRRKVVANWHSVHSRTSELIKTSENHGCILS